MTLSAINFDSITFLVASLYLWLLFGFLSDTVSCDLKRLFRNPFFRHFTALASIFLLFTLIDSHNYSASYIWKQSFLLYLFYIFLTKNKWYFALPVLILMLVEQTISAQINHLASIKYSDNKKDKNKKQLNDITIQNYNNYKNYLQYFIITLIIVGFIQYFIRQKNEFKSQFSLFKFIFDTTCKY
jgi:uncharacterized membrane protein YraQ (UPF0718 family)